MYRRNEHDVILHSVIKRFTPSNYYICYKHNTERGLFLIIHNPTELILPKRTRTSWCRDEMERLFIFIFLANCILFYASENVDTIRSNCFQSNKKYIFLFVHSFVRLCVRAFVPSFLPSFSLVHSFIQHTESW